jgi:hypothetical protein
MKGKNVKAKLLIANMQSRINAYNRTVNDESVSLNYRCECDSIATGLIVAQNMVADYFNLDVKKTVQEIKDLETARDNQRVQTG